MKPGTRDQSAYRLRMLGLTAVCLGVAALAAAAFVLSYSAIRAVALGSGVSPRHAGDYPVLIDAMLVIALLAVLGLRGAGVPSRALSWLALLAVLAVGAAADVQYATGRVLQQYTAAATTAAVLPWALVFLAFVLLLALLRHGRLRHQASVARRQLPMVTDAHPPDAGPPVAAPPARSLPVRTPREAPDSASIVPGFSARLVSSAAAGAAAGAAAATAEQPGPAGEAGHHNPAHPGRDEVDADAETTPADRLAEPARAAAARQEPADAGMTLADAGTDLSGHLAEPASAAPTEAEPADAMPGEPPAENSGPPADDDPPAGSTHAPGDDATPSGADNVDTRPTPDDGDDPGASDAAAADQNADDAADNMPVFHRMWSTPTPPDS